MSCGVEKKIKAQFLKKNNSDQGEENVEFSNVIIQDSPKNEESPSKKRFEPLPNNLIENCKYDGFAIYDCVFESKEIIPKQTTRKMFEIRYQFGNCGITMDAFEIEDLNLNQSYALKQWGNLEVQTIYLNGIGPFVLRPFNEERFQTSFYWEKCFFKIIEIKDWN